MPSIYWLREALAPEEGGDPLAGRTSRGQYIDGHHLAILHIQK